MSFRTEVALLTIPWCALSPVPQTSPVVPAERRDAASSATHSGTQSETSMGLERRSVMRSSMLTAARQG